MKDDQTTIDTLLNIGAGCDLITPVYVIVRDAYVESVVHFGVVANAGFDRGAIRRLLNANGVQSWGYIYNVDGDLIMFSVREEQATAANEVLKRGGVPVLCGPGEAVKGDTQPTPTRPSVALNNSFHTGEMQLVKAPSLWDLLGRLIARIGD